MSRFQFETPTDCSPHYFLRLFFRFLRRFILSCCSVAGIGVAACQQTPLEQHLQAAQQAQAQQDCGTAAREYGLAVRLAPKSGELYSNYGVTLYCAGQLQEAVAAFQKALALSPKLAAPHLFLGLAANHQGDYAKAVRDLQIVLSANPSDETARLWLGYTYVAQGQFEAAVAQFDKVLLLDRANTDAEYALGQSWLEIGRRKAQALATLAPSSPYLLQLVAEQDKLAGDPGGAQAVAAEANKRQVSFTATAQGRAEQKKLFQESASAEQHAQDAFAAVLHDAPDSYRAHQILADIDLVRQQLPDAIAEYRKVLELNPDLPGVHESISNCLMRTYHPVDALAELRAEQRLQPHSSKVLTEIARVQMDAGDTDGAAVSVHEAMKGADAPAEAFVLVGKIELRQGDAPGAITALRTAIAKDAATPVAYYLLARACRITGDKEGAAKAIETYHRFSQDEQQRKEMDRATRNPDSQPPITDSQEASDDKPAATAGP